MIRLLLILTGFTLFYSCAGTRSAKNSEAKLRKLQKVMTGSYDSSAQAAGDPTYFDISLHMYPIWENKKGIWLYVEQAMSSAPQNPYRQRIYKIEGMEDGSFVSKVFKFDDPGIFIGKWSQPSFFDQYDDKILLEREGCEVYLKKTGKDKYQGSTKGKECSSSLRGSTYATAEVTISAQELNSWDQGFDDKDVQVWGATKGAYRFVKKEKN